MELVVGVISCVFAVGLGALLALEPNREARVFAAVSIAAGIFVLALTLLYWTRLFVFSGMIIASGALMLDMALAFALVFMRRPSAWEYAALAPMAAVIPLAWTHLFVSGMQIVDGAPEPVNGSWAPWLATLVVAYCAAIMARFVYIAYAAPRRKRIQTGVVALGFAILLACVVACNVIAPLRGVPTANMVTALGLVVFLACAAYALATRRLFDVQVALYRWVTRAIVPACVIAGSAFVTGACDLVRVTWSPHGWIAMAVLGGVLGAVVAEIILPHGTALAQRVLFPGALTLKRGAELVAEAVAPLATSAELKAVLAALLRQLFAASSVSLVDDDAGEAHKEKDALRIPVEGWGTYVLKRKNDRAFSTFDIDMAHQIVPALVGAARRARERDYERDTAHQAERRLVADIAHGLQTPLAVLRAHVEDGATSEMRLTIGRAVDELSMRMRELIAFARAGMPLGERSAAVPFAALITEAVEYVGVVALERGVLLHVGDIQDVTVQGRKDDLNTMVLNVLGNALEHAARGMQHDVFIDLVRIDNRAVLTIADTGPGMTDDELAHAGSPLYQGSGRQGKGMGLGLAIARQVAETHGGSLLLERKIPSGVRATIALPIAAPGLLH